MRWIKIESDSEVVNTDCKNFFLIFAHQKNMEVFIMMRRANGQGSVFKVKGENRRKPWRVRVTVDYEIKDDKVTQKVINVGYFATRVEAETALNNYLSNPYDLNTKDITFKEVYEAWSDRYFDTLDHDSSRRTVKSAFDYMHTLHNKRIRDIKVSQLKRCLEEAYVIVKEGKHKGEKKMASPSTKARMKSVFNLIFDYAVENELVTANYARNFNLSEDIRKACEREKREVVIFSNKELEKLWDNIHEVRFVDMVLIGIYSGWRPRELAELKVKDINLDKGFMRGGCKTDAGRNRIVPIHPVIRELVEKRCRMAEGMGSDYLFNDKEGQQGTHMTYDKYRGRFNKVMEYLDMKGHRPHETRHTFITNCKRSGVDDNILKRIVGHKNYDITEGTYTHRKPFELKKELAKIDKFLPDGEDYFGDDWVE